MLGHLLLSEEEDEQDASALEELIEPRTPVRPAEHHDPDVPLHRKEEPAQGCAHERNKHELFHLFILVGATRHTITQAVASRSRHVIVRKTLRSCHAKSLAHAYAGAHKG